MAPMRLTGAFRRRLRRTGEAQRLRSVAALAAVAAIVVWSALSVVDAFGTVNGGRSATSSQYEYPPSTWSITGSGTIGDTGQVSFDLSFKVAPGGSTGTCTVVAPKTKTKVKCLGVTFATLSNDGTVASLSGPATLNGAQTTYQITAKDAGSPGVGADSFSITAGSFSRSGTLTSGNITIHA
jgi:hypothetical protein